METIKAFSRLYFSRYSNASLMKNRLAIGRGEADAVLAKRGESAALIQGSETLGQEG